MNRSVVPVILSGGSGTRLWPLSRELRPKQFLPLVGERTLLQETLLRVEPLGTRLREPIIVCNESHRFMVAEQLRCLGTRPHKIVLEPVGRNTAPAVAVAAWLALEGMQSSDDASAPDAETDALLLVMPADHVIADVSAFTRAVATALDVASRGYLVAFGIVPESAETGYGYVKRGKTGDDTASWHVLERFVEKPDTETARRYVNSGEFFWNSGMFVFSAKRYLEELERHAPDIAAVCRTVAAQPFASNDFVRLRDEFRSCRSDSIDYAVMEKTDRAAVVPLEAGWSDIGSWSALHQVLPRDAEGNVLRGDVIAHACRNSYICANTRLVAAVGVENHVIVETPDAILVMPLSAAQDVKCVVDKLKAQGRGELQSHDKAFDRGIGS